MASLQKNVASQNVTFVLVNASSGAALTGATVTVKFTLDNGSQTAGGGTVTEKGNGQYNYSPAATETNGTDVGFLFTAASAIPVNMDFHMDPAFFANLNLDANGNIGVTSTFKKGIARAGFMFPVTDSTTHQLKTGVTFSAGQSLRAIDGNPQANTTNLPTEVGGGIYAINLSATDLTGNNIIFTFSATNCDPTVIEIPTSP